MPRASMRWHARQLRKAGHTPHIFSYATVAGGPEAAVPALLQELREPCDILAHSLGGLVAVHALQQYPDLPVRRVVCLGSPLCGSAAATGMARLPLGARTLGRSVSLLRDGCRPWTGPAELGMVAGDAPIGLGQMFGRFAGRSDGTVAVAETRIDGLADHIVLPTSHTGLLLSARAARQVTHFLAHGRFARENG
ncbi:MAG: esterase/lipase family protein [Lysobacter sp.]